MWLIILCNICVAPSWDQRLPQINRQLCKQALMKKLASWYLKLYYPNQFLNIFTSDCDITKDFGRFYSVINVVHHTIIFQYYQCVKSGSETSIAQCCLHNQSWVKYHRKPCIVFNPWQILDCNYIWLNSHNCHKNPAINCAFTRTCTSFWFMLTVLITGELV